MVEVSEKARQLLRLTLTPNLGPVLIARLLEQFGTPEAALACAPAQLERVKGIGSQKSAAIAAGLRDSQALADKELEDCARLGVRLVSIDDAAYPPLLKTTHGPPPLLYVKGGLDCSETDKFPFAIVGSRHCSPYGIEQAQRFAGVLAGAGLTIVSGGARGIDTAAHRGALQNQGRTVVVAGCGLSQCFPPENQKLFDQVVASGGALVSELPLATAPTPENFPPRNRIVSGMSLGTLVIEAGLQSGALITARLAAEDHGREVFAVPGRVDSPASRGTLELIKAGGALLVTDPGDILSALESPARHLHVGTFEDRYAAARSQAPLFSETESARTADAPAAAPPPTDPDQRTILSALDESLTADELSQRTGLEAHKLRAALTVLEIQKRITRRGPYFSRSR